MHPVVVASEITTPPWREHERIDVVVSKQHGGISPGHNNTPLSHWASLFFPSALVPTVVLFAN
jgi:hypothetical protein